LKYLFLTYVNRSGSTLLANILSRSPRVEVFPEGEALIEPLLVRPEESVSTHLLNRIQTLFRSDPKLKAWKVDPQILWDAPATTRIGLFLHLLEKAARKGKPQAEWVLFKAERLIDLFPSLESSLKRRGIETKMVTIVRDVRGVYASQRLTPFPGTRRPMSRNPVGTARFWKEHLRKAGKMKEKILLIRYEELVNHPEKGMAPLIRTLALDPFPLFETSETLYKHLPPEQQRIHELADGPPDPSRALRWQSVLSEKELFSIEKVAGKTLMAWGYPLSNPSSSPSRRLALHLWTFRYLCHGMGKKISDPFRFRLGKLLKRY